MNPVTTTLFLVGIGIMAYALYLSIKLKVIFNSRKAWFSFGGKLRKAWGIITSLIFFFLTSYVIMGIMQITRIDLINPVMLTSIVFVVGATFVLLVVFLNYETFSKFAVH